MIEQIVDTNTREIYKIFQDFFGEDRVDLQFSEKILENTSLHELGNATNFPADNLVLANICDSAEMEKDRVNLSLYDFLVKYPSTYVQVLDRGLFDLHTNYVTKIIIHFPEIKVTNENNDSTVIRDLWIKVPIKVNGTGMGYFGVNRSTYSYYHYLNNYLHSHVLEIPIRNPKFFQSPCLGSGPISDTVNSLALNCDFSLWQLFCLELDRYVRTESLDGVPYHKMVECNSNNIRQTVHPASANYMSINNKDQFDAPVPHFMDFIEYLFKSNELKFTSIDDTIVLAMSWEDYLLTLTNVFIKWLNITLSHKTLAEKNEYRRRVFEKYLIPAKKHNACFNYIIENNTYDNLNAIENMEGRTICTFKGQEVKIHIEDSDTMQNGSHGLLLLRSNFATTLLNRIILTLNNEKYRRRIQNRTKTCFL